MNDPELVAERERLTAATELYDREPTGKMTGIAEHVPLPSAHLEREQDNHDPSRCMICRAGNTWHHDPIAGTSVT